ARVEYTDDWQEDARRRDFTMNALSLSPEGEIFDYFGGIKDAKEGHVRFIGEPAERIREDYLRILRFFRFFAHYGKGEPDKNALAACAAQAFHLSKLSGERLQQEMFKLLSSPHAVATLTLMQETGVLSQTLAVEIKSLKPLAALESFPEKADPVLKL